MNSYCAVNISFLENIDNHREPTSNSRTPNWGLRPASCAILNRLSTTVPEHTAKEKGLPNPSLGSPFQVNESSARRILFLLWSCSFQCGLAGGATGAAVIGAVLGFDRYRSCLAFLHGHGHFAGRASHCLGGRSLWLLGISSNHCGKGDYGDDTLDCVLHATDSGRKLLIFD